MPKEIEWKTKTSESRVDATSADGVWQLRTDENDGVRKCYLFNNNVLCSPIGSGADALDCWRAFVKACDGYMAKVAEARAEALEILAGLENA